MPSKFAGWSSNRFRDAGFRAVPGSIVRRSAYIAPNVVLMPSFVNVGAYVDSGTMVDTWATVGSCAQIGKNCHLSGGVGIGGVLEPLQAEPVIIEDNCFIGARSEVVEGVIVEQGAVLAMGTFIGATTKIVDRDTGEIHMGRVPAYSVVVPGSLPGRNLPDGSPGPSLYCAVIVKQVDEQTRARTSINELLARMSERGCRADRPGGARRRADPPAERHPEGRGRARHRRGAAGAARLHLPPAGLRRPGRMARPRRSPTSTPASAPAARICALPAIPTWCRPAPPRPGRSSRSPPCCATARCAAAAPST